MNITDVLDECGIDYAEGGTHHHVSHGWVGVDCPFCGSTNKHLGIHKESFACFCWRCGSHRLRDLLNEIQAPKQLRKQLERERVAPPQRTRGTLKRPVGVQPMQKPHRRYLQRRGFDDQQIEQIWQVQGIGLAAKLAWRLYIPIFHRSEEVSWTTRSIGEGSTSKYVSAPPECEAEPLHDLLYGIDYAHHVVVVCEGPADVWRIGPGAVALLGLNASSKHIERLSRFPLRAICFDNELQAQRRARNLADQLSAFDGETWVVTLDAEDPGSATQREVAALRQELYL